MAEILVKAVSSAALADLTKDQRGSYKRGMPVVVMPDGHPWGRREGLPNFIVVKLPGVSAERVKKYIEAESTVVDGEVVTTRRRIWRIRFADLPAATRTKLQATGELIIKADAAYNGTFDYTWTQVKGFWLNTVTGLDETADV